MNIDLIRLHFPKQAERIEAGLCPTCGIKVGEFRNERSKREFQISGLCQECQDNVFGED
jgi:hypothetical protein